jgi:hypothetical protein
MGTAESILEIQRMAKEFGVGLDPAPYRTTTKPAPTDALNGIMAIIGEHREDVVSDRPSPSQRKGPMTASAMRDSLREVGIDLGHQREDSEDREHYARHEAGHAVAAHGLGWHVVYCDARAGQTKIEGPEYWTQSLGDRHRQHAAIAAAGSVAAGTSSWRDENLNDRVAVRLKGHTDFEAARKSAERVLADRWAKPALKRLTAALLEHGRLEGAELQRVLEDD